MSDIELRILNAIKAERLGSIVSKLIHYWASGERLTPVDECEETLLNVLYALFDAKKEKIDSTTHARSAAGQKGGRPRKKVATEGIEAPMVEHADVTKVREAWNSLGLNQVKEVKNRRLAALNARIREHGLPEVLEMITKVNNSPFLKGRNDRAFTATLDWCLRPNNYDKIMADNYLERSLTQTTMQANAAELTQLVLNRQKMANKC